LFFLFFFSIRIVWANPRTSPRSFTQPITAALSGYVGRFRPCSTSAWLMLALLCCCIACELKCSGIDDRTAGRIALRGYVTHGASTLLHHRRDFWLTLEHPEAPAPRPDNGMHLLERRGDAKGLNRRSHIYCSTSNRNRFMRIISKSYNRMTAENNVSGAITCFSFFSHLSSLIINHMSEHVEKSAFFCANFGILRSRMKPTLA